MKTKYGVFIIESLSEKNGDYFDGELLAEILELSDIPVIYLSLENISDLEAGIKEFLESKYRYLHFSFHGNTDGIQLKDEYISNYDFGEIIGYSLAQRRVFLSACKGGNRNLSSILISHGAYSLIGTPINLKFVKAALFWPAFYHAIYELDEITMKRNEINTILKACSMLFNTPINYYSFIRNNKKSFKRLKIRNGRIGSSNVLKIM